MQQPRPIGSAEKKSSSKLSFGAFGVSLILHVSIFLLVGSYVMFEGVVPRSPFVGTIAAPADVSEIMDIPDITDEMPMPEMMDMPVTEASSAAAEQTSPMDLIISSAPSTTFSLPPVGSGPTINPNIGAGSGGSGTGQARGPSTARAAGSLFGARDVISGALEGTMYDLKQNRRGQPTNVNPGSYNNILKEFFRRGWNTKVMKDYFAVEQKLYQTQFYAPIINADQAPKAFGVEGVVKPSLWVIHYVGTAAAPASGRFRFVGYADDNIIVRWDGRDVLDGSRSAVGFHNDIGQVAEVRDQEIKQSHKAGNGHMAYGPWINMQKGVVAPVEILVGERPGGNLCFYLMIQQEGVEYQKDNAGNPALPLFRLAPSSRRDDEALMRGTNPPRIAREQVSFGSG